MTKTLVAIEVDLASSMAIRYACDLGNLIPMELFPVYVKAPPPEMPATGTGWVRHTWERQIVEMGQEEIHEMLASEQETCPRLQDPRVIYGDREYEYPTAPTLEVLSKACLPPYLAASFAEDPPSRNSLPGFSWGPRNSAGLK
jgi:hypothetical protein